MVPPGRGLLDEVVTISEFSRSCVAADLDVDAARVTVIPLPGDPSSSERMRRIRESRPVGPHVLYVGRFAPHKNLDRLVAAFDRSALARSGGRLVLLGGTDDEVDATSRVAAGVSAEVLVLGRRPQAELEELMATAAALVQPSLEEGYGLPVQEALLAGVPVAAARAGALPEVAAGRAELFDPLDLDYIARAIDDAAPRAPTALRPAGVDMDPTAYARRFLAVIG